MVEQRLSARMEANAALVSPGGVFADIGTDHGYLPIALVERGIVSRAIAMDLREGPLAHARENIAKHGLGERIETRLSDGVRQLQPGEADSILIAGMGGELVVRILTEGQAVCQAARELILQPQSEIAMVRSFLRQQGYLITDENMVYEDGKFYTMMRVASEVHKKSTPTDSGDDRQQLLEDTYGACLLRAKHPVLQQYLQWQKQQLRDILLGLQKQESSNKIRSRMEEVQQKLALNHAAQEQMHTET